MNAFHPKQQGKRLSRSRLFITVILVLLQLLLLLALGQLFHRFAVLLRLLGLCLVFWILSRPDDPSYQISWILILLLFPLTGSLFYLIFGNKRFGLNMKKQLEAFRAAQPAPNPDDCLLPEAALSPSQRKLAEYLRRCAGAPLHDDGSAVYFPTGEALFQCMLEKLKQAQKFIFLEYFIVAEGVLWTSVLEILEQKAANGVEIRILYDDAGCLATLPEGYDKLLREKGIHTAIFNPIQPRLNTMLNYRDHRKICVIDGCCAFTGGANLSDEYINLQERHGHWKDSGIMVQGSAANNLCLLFLQLWQFSTGERLNSENYCCPMSHGNSTLLQPFGSDPMSSRSVGRNAYLLLFHHAAQSLWLTSPYLILDSETCSALQLAAQSGVDVRIITPHIPDKWYVHALTQSFYRPLLEAGVRIFEYTPGFIHAKMALCDGCSAIVGSTNLDYRSFYLQFECAVILYNSPAIPAIREDFLATEALSQEITLEQVRQTPLHQRLLRSILRLLAPLM